MNSTKPTAAAAPQPVLLRFVPDSEGAETLEACGDTITEALENLHKAIEKSTGTQMEWLQEEFAEAAIELETDPEFNFHDFSTPEDGYTIYRLPAAAPTPAAVSLERAVAPLIAALEHAQMALAGFVGKGRTQAVIDAYSHVTNALNAAKRD